MTRAVVAAVSVVVALGACTSSRPDPSATTATSIGSPVTTTGSTGDSTRVSTGVDAEAPLRVDLIAPAVAAVEAQLGGPADYYEINATPALVNLFVAGEDRSVTAFAYVAGALTSEQLEGEAGGATFRATALDFDPATVTSHVSDELPTSRQDAFEIVGGPNGAVRYSIVVTSAAGGQLIVQVAGDGTVVAVDPV